VGISLQLGQQLPAHVVEHLLRCPARRTAPMAATHQSHPQGLEETQCDLALIFVIANLPSNLLKGPWAGSEVHFGGLVVAMRETSSALHWLQRECRM